MKTIRTALAALALLACSAPPHSQANSQQAPPGSAFAAAPEQRWRLPAALREISGMAATADGRIFAHDDERAVLYELDLANGGVGKAFSLGDPALAGDFEGLAITPDGDFFLITSQGAIYRFREAAHGAQADFQIFDTGLRDVCEIEGLAYSDAEGRLIIACKENRARSARSTVSIYAWGPGAGTAEPWRSWPENTLTEMAGIRRFRPSSLEFDRASGRLLMLSARDGALAEIEDGAIMAARALDSLHVQAESLAITADGALLIADEGGDGRALLSRYGRGQ